MTEEDPMALPRRRLPCFRSGATTHPDVVLETHLKHFYGGVFTVGAV